MFSLDGTYRYWLYNKPVDMRKSFNGLSGIVTNAMCERLRSGDVFIFVNSSRNMMKMLRQEEGGLVLYAIRLDMGRMRLPAIGGDCRNPPRTSAELPRRAATRGQPRLRAP